jgi:hypothetical protein
LRGSPTETTAQVNDLGGPYVSLLAKPIHFDQKLQTALRSTSNRFCGDDIENPLPRDCHPHSRESGIFFTYDPFFGLEDLSLPEPVFMHAKPCLRYSEDSEFPTDARQHRLTFAAYAEKRRLRAEEHAQSRGRTGYPESVKCCSRESIHVRNIEAGCHDFRIERGRPMAENKTQPRVLSNPASFTTRACLREG